MCDMNKYVFFQTIEQLKKEINLLKTRISILEKTKLKEDKFILGFMVKNKDSNKDNILNKVKFIPYKNNNEKIYEFSDINDAINYVNDFKYLFFNRVYIYDKCNNEHIKLHFLPNGKYYLK